MQHFLNFFPLPQGHGSFRPTFTSGTDEDLPAPGETLQVPVASVPVPTAPGRAAAMPGKGRTVPAAPACCVLPAKIIAPSNGEAPPDEIEELTHFRCPVKEIGDGGSHELLAAEAMEGGIR
jgi:hypothetical protein